MPPQTTDFAILRPQFSSSEVFTAIEILDVTEIDQDTGTFAVFIHIEMDWRDNNLKFAFLKENAYENGINDTVADAIWTPKFEFAFLEDLETIFKRIVVIRENEPTMSGDIDELHPIGKVTFIHFFGF